MKIHLKYILIQNCFDWMKIYFDIIWIYFIECKKFSYGKNDYCCIISATLTLRDIFSGGCFLD